MRSGLIWAALAVIATLLLLVSGNLGRNRAMLTLNKAIATNQLANLTITNASPQSTLLATLLADPHSTSQLAPTDLTTTRHAANFLYQNGQYESALPIYTYLSETAGSPQIQFELARTYQALGDDRALLSYFGLTQSPTTPTEIIGASYYQQGIILSDQDDWQSAQDALNKSLDYVPDNASAEFYLARATLRLGDMSTALTITESLLLRNPADLNSRNLLAEIQARQGDCELALTTYQDTLTRDPNNTTAQNSIARLDTFCGVPPNE